MGALGTASLGLVANSLSITPTSSVVAGASISITINGQNTGTASV